MNPAILRTIVFPLQETLRGGRFLRFLRELDRQQWLSADEVHALQVSKLRAVLEHCGQHVPFYQRLFREHGFDPAVRSLDALRQLPPLTKADLQQRQRELMAVNMPKREFLPNRSGGSSGIPTQFFLDSRCLDYARAAQYRYYSWIGLRYGDRQALLWGSPLDLSQARRLQRRVRSFFLNKLWLDANQLNEPALEVYARELISFQPRILVGYATALWSFAEFALLRGLRFPSLLGAVSTAEVLPPQKRELIERGLGVKVYDRYGCGEMKDIAQQCGASPHSHVNADNVLVELLDGDRPAAPGTVGEIVCTNLNNYAMPLIRYRLGDMGRAIDEACPCGRGLPMMSLLSGRIYEILTVANGTRLHAALINHIMYALPGVRQYQLVQEAPNRIVCRIVRGPGFSREVVNHIRAEMRQHVGADIELSIQFPERIEPAPSGKHQFIYSKVKPQPPAGATT